MIPRYTVSELMAVAVSRELRDGDHAFVGLGTGGRAFVNAVGVPSVGIELARRRGLDVVAQYGVLYEPDLAHPPRCFADPYLIRWPAKAHVAVDEGLDTFRRGKITVSFISGAQIDPYGNLNSVAIGPDRRRPEVRLTGPIAQTDHAVYAGRTIIILPHARRTFVPRVDFISAVGYLGGPGDRERLGLPGGGPSVVITDLAVLRFHPVTRRMELESVHPGVTVQQVAEATGFEVVPPCEVPATPPPSAEELRLIREEIDPHGIWLGGAAR